MGYVITNNKHALNNFQALKMAMMKEIIFGLAILFATCMQLSNCYFYCCGFYCEEKWCCGYFCRGGEAEEKAKLRNLRTLFSSADADGVINIGGGTSMIETTPDPKRHHGPPNVLDQYHGCCWLEKCYNHMGGPKFCFYYSNKISAHEGVSGHETVTECELKCAKWYLNVSKVNKGICKDIKGGPH